MRKADLEVGVSYLTRWGYVAQLKAVTPYRVYINDGHRNISAHWSDLIRKYNGGRENGIEHMPSDGGTEVLGSEG